MNYKARSPKPWKSTKRKKFTSSAPNDAQELRRVQWISIGGLVSNFKFPKNKERTTQDVDIFFI